MDVADLPASRRKVVVALVPLNARQLNQRRCHHMNGIAGQVRVGDVALHALDRQSASEAAAATILDGVPGLCFGRRLANDTIIKPLATRLQHPADGNGAINSRSFFIAGEQKADVESRIRRGGHIGLCRDNHGGQWSFHVAGAPPVQLALSHTGLERGAAPLLQWTRRHNIDMPGKHHRGARRSINSLPQRPEIAHEKAGRPTIHALTDEAQGSQLLRKQRQATTFFRCDRCAGDQPLRKKQCGIRHEKTIGREMPPSSQTNGQTQELQANWPESVPHVQRNLGK